MDPDTATNATWIAWLDDVVGSDIDAKVARRAGFDRSTVNRWRTSGAKPDPIAAVKVARAYHVSPLAALVAAGVLTDEEVSAAPRTTRDAILSAPPQALADELVARIHRLEARARDTSAPLRVAAKRGASRGAAARSAQDRDAESGGA